jgi:hypothetical protein
MLDILMSRSEDEAIAKSLGKWSQAGFPHRGWTCVEVEDNGQAGPICEMCESRRIRYIHHMSHPDVATSLACGCVCAGYMEGDLAAARRRDALMTSRAGKRSRWLTRKWKESAKGNDWIKADGFAVTIYRDKRGYSKAAVVSDERDFKHFTRQSYRDPSDAKLAAFDLITRVLAEEEERRNEVR